MSNSLQSSSYCFPGTQDSSDPILSNTFIEDVHRDKDEDKWQKGILVQMINGRDKIISRGTDVPKK